MRAREYLALPCAVFHAAFRRQRASFAACTRLHSSPPALFISPSSNADACEIGGRGAPWCMDGHASDWVGSSTKAAVIGAHRLCCWCHRALLPAPAACAAPAACQTAAVRRLSISGCTNGMPYGIKAALARLLYSAQMSFPDSAELDALVRRGCPVAVRRRVVGGVGGGAGELERHCRTCRDVGSR